ncbi:MAG: peptidylprolyl isomerase [Vicinamibacterales bacterium]
MLLLSLGSGLAFQPRRQAAPDWTPRLGRRAVLSVVALCGLATPILVAAQTAPAKPPTTQAKPAAPRIAPKPVGPVIVVDTVKGVIEIELYPDDAPKGVDHILNLVQKNFYTGHRVHRVVKGGLIQFGDPLSKDMTKQNVWGQGGLGSGKVVGVAEFSKRHLHVRGAVGLAHAGDATQADSQMYIVMVPRPQYDGKYSVIGHVISGMDVVAKIEEADRIKTVSLKPGTLK